MGDLPELEGVDGEYREMLPVYRIGVFYWLHYILRRIEAFLFIEYRP